MEETENILLYIVDRDNSGGITFGDFMDFLSSLSKGSEEEKILWSFRFYDINKDGIISRDEMIKVCDSIIFLTTAATELRTQHLFVLFVFAEERQFH